MTKQRVVGAALAAAVAATVVAPVADGAMPAVCSNERTGETLAQIWGGSDFWAINIFGDQSTLGFNSPGFNSVKVSVVGPTRNGRPQGEFPAFAMYGVRTDPNSEYVETPGYGGVDADGYPVLYVPLPETYNSSTGTLQIRTDDPDKALPAATTGGTSAKLYTAAAAQASIRTLDEFGDSAQRIPASVKAEEFTFPASRHSADGTVHFDHVLPCTPATVEFGIPKYSKFTAADAVSSDGLAPATDTGLGTRTIPFERGSLRVSISDADGQRAMLQPIQVEGPGGAQTVTTNDGGLLTLPNARAGEYTLSATSNGATLRKTVFLKPGEDLSESAKFVAAPGSGTQSTATVTSTVVVSETVTPPPVAWNWPAIETRTMPATTETITRSSSVIETRTMPATVVTITRPRSVTVTRTMPATTETRAPVIVTSTALQPVVTQTPSVATTTQTVAVDPNGRVVLLATLAAVATLGGAVAAVMGSVPGLDVQQLAARIGGGN